MAFELTRWRATEADWARGEQAAFVRAPETTVAGAEGEEEKLPWLPAAAVVGVLGLMFFWTKKQAQKHNRMAQASVFAPVLDEEGLEQTQKLPSETMKQLVFSDQEKKLT